MQEAFHTMKDFSDFVNGYLTAEQVSVLAYSYASDLEELSLLVTIDDYQMLCRWHVIWTFSGVHQTYFQTVMMTENSFAVAEDSLQIQVRFQEQDLRFQATQLEMSLLELPEPLYRLAKVSFSEGGKTYSYRCEDHSIQVDDWVMVPVGAKNHGKEAHIEEIVYVSEEESDYPLADMKTVLEKLDLVTIDYDVQVRQKGLLTFSGISYQGGELDEETDLLWVPFLADLDDLSKTTYGIRMEQDGQQRYMTALQEERFDQEMVVLSPSLYAVFTVQGPARLAIWASWQYTKQHYEVLELPSVEVYPAGNRRAEDYKMEVWIPIQRRA